MYVRSIWKGGVYADIKAKNWENFRSYIVITHKEQVRT